MRGGGGGLLEVVFVLAMSYDGLEYRVSLYGKFVVKLKPFGG